MSLPLIALIVLAIFAIYFIYKNSDDFAKTVDNCILSKIVTPFKILFNEFYSNTGLIIDDILNDHIIVNTPFRTLYGMQVVGLSNYPYFLSQGELDKLYRTYANKPNSFFIYVLLKQGIINKQYIFCYNKELIQNFATYFNTSLLSGQEVANAILDLYLQNDFKIENKQIKRNIELDFNDVTKSNYAILKKLFKEFIYTNLIKTDLYQAYKPINMVETDLQKLFRLDFEGAVWNYFSFNHSEVSNALTRLVNMSKLHGNREPFVKLQEAYKKNEQPLILSNATLHLTKYDKSVISNIGNCLKTEFLEKNLFKKEILRKTGLKYRDTEFDYIAPLSYLENYIASTHKKDTKNADIYGYDKNHCFVNYSFADENTNPHMAIIGESGSGKSVSKQMIIAQMIGLDFTTGLAHNLGNNGVKLRGFDIGFSDEILVNFVKSNPKNNIEQISSELGSFAYNICSIETTDKDIFDTDLQFAIDLMSVILSSQGDEPLNTAESSLFKATFRDIIQFKRFQSRRIDDIFDKDVKQELLDLGYDLITRISDIKEEKYAQLNVPLLTDVINEVSTASFNKQISEEDRKNFGSLTTKLKNIDRQQYFSRLTLTKLSNADFLHMDLNNYKENSLFVPIFLCIFLKTYFKDRSFALECKRKRIKAPKLLYTLEESANFFRVPHFEVMLEKVALEARKYNVHLCLIAQYAHQIPKRIIQSLATRIVLIIPKKKGETIADIRERFAPEEIVLQQLEKTDKHEMCIWYTGGVFTMKFDMSPAMLEVFNTNPNAVS